MPENKPKHAPGRLPEVPGFIEQALEAGLTQGGWMLYLRLWQTLVERERLRGTKTMPMTGSRAHRLVPEVSKATAKRALRDLVDKDLLYVKHEPGYRDPSVGLRLTPAHAGKPGSTKTSDEKVVELSDFTPPSLPPKRPRARTNDPVDGNRPIEPIATSCPNAEPTPPDPEPELQRPSDDDQKRFEDARQRLASMIEAHEHEAWGATLQLTRAAKGVAVITAPSDLALEMARSHQSVIEDACRQAGFEGVKLTGEQPAQPSSPAAPTKQTPKQPQWPPRTITVGDARWIAMQVIGWRDQFRERHQTEPGHGAQEVTGWVLYQVVCGASANPKISVRDAAKGVMSMIYAGTYTRPRGFQAAAVAPHMEAVVDLFDQGGHQ